MKYINKKSIGGGNKKKGIPPTSTNFYGLMCRKKKVMRIKAGMKKTSDNKYVYPFI